MREEKTQDRFVQKSLLGTYRTKFQFGDETLRFAKTYKGQSVAFDVPYELIPRHPKDIKMIDSRLYVVALLFLLFFWIAMTEFLSRWSVSNSSNDALFLTAVLVLPLKLLADKNRIKLISYETKRGNLFILKDKSAKEIQDKIDATRHVRVLALYSGIDFSRPLELEANKFLWLKNEGYISPEEYLDTMSRLNDRNDAPLDVAKKLN